MTQLLDSITRDLAMTREDGGDFFLNFKDGSQWYDESRDAAPEDITLEAIADLLDQKAESCNAHDFVMCHRGLAGILFHTIGRDDATRVMRKIADFEGLFGLVGVCGKGDVAAHEKALGYSVRDWSDWSLPLAEQGAQS